MSMGCSVRVVLTTDDNYDKMYKVYKACKDAGVSFPREVECYFGSAIDNDEVHESGTTKKLVVTPEYDEENDETVYTVPISALPESTEAIQFVLW